MAEKNKSKRKRYASDDIHGTRLQVYPGKRNYMMVIARANSLLQSASSTVDEILKHYFETNFTDIQRDKLLRSFEKMSEEERRNPGRI